MKKTMIYLPEDTHEALRKMAFTHRVSIAELIRRAVDAAYGEDIEDITDMEREAAEYRAHPESSIDLDTYLEQREPRVKPPKARVQS